MHAVCHLDISIHVSIDVHIKVYHALICMHIGLPFDPLPEADLSSH